MALSFGGTIPLKEFAAYSDLTKNGFALNGFTGDYSGGFFTQKKFGIGGNIRYASHPVEEKVVQALLAQELPDDFPLTEQPSYIPGFWKHISFLAGPEYTISQSKANIDLFVLSGINFILPPEMSTYAVNQNDYYKRKMEVRTVNLGFEAGCALRIHLNEYTSVRFHASWFISKCDGNIIHEMELQGEKTYNKEKYSCPINTLNGGIGITYRL